MIAKAFEAMPFATTYRLYVPVGMLGRSNMVVPIVPGAIEWVLSS